MISVFGATGFIGSNWMKNFPEISYAEPRESIVPKYNNILYLRGTNSNYNVFQDPTLDVKSNLILLTETFKNITPNYTFNLVSSWFASYPKGFYSATKLCQELLTESFCKTFDIPYRIIRPCNVVGGDTKFSGNKNALEWMIDKLKKNQAVQIYDGQNLRNYIYITDFCNALKLILDKGKYEIIYTVGNEHSYDMIDIIKCCRNLLGSRSPVEIIPRPKFYSLVQPQNYIADTSDLARLGFKCQYNTLEKVCEQLCFNHN